MRAFQTAQGLGPDGMMDRGGETEAALCDAAKRLQSMGRHGDTLLAHITPAEARLLDAVTDGGSINPTTGLLEFWGRMGGSKYSREQRAEADSRAASPNGNAGNNTQDDGGRTYTDAQLAGAVRANEEAARTREKVRNYLGRTGTSANDSAITRADAHAPQQADASQPAEPAQAREQDANAAAQQARRYAATTLHKNPSAGLLTQKSTSAPSANRYTAALSSSMQRAQNAAAAAATAETATTTATATAPMTPGTDPRLSPSATPAQQARNITQARRAAEENANAVAARTRQNVKDYLGKTQSTRTPTTATRRAHATIPQGGTWLDSVQAQTGYRLTPASAAQQPRAFNQQHLNAAASANATNAISRARVRDYLDIMSQTPKTPEQSSAEARQAAWSEAKSQAKPISSTVPTPSAFQQSVKLDFLQKGFQIAARAADIVGLDQASTNLDHFLNGNGETITLSKKEARKSPAIKNSEMINNNRIANNTFTGNTHNSRINSNMRNLKHGQTISIADHWDKGSSDWDTVTNALSKANGINNALAYGRQTLKSNVTVMATRKNNTVHIQGIVNHSMNDTYDFHEGRTGSIIGAKALQDSNRGKPFDTKSSWRQSVTGTVDILGQDENGNILGNPNLTWKDID